MKFDADSSSEIKSTHPLSRRISSNEVGFHRRRRFRPPARVDLKEKFVSAVIKALALVTILIGISSAIETEDILCIIICMALGTLLGEITRIDDGIEGAGELIKGKLLHICFVFHNMTSRENFIVRRQQNAPKMCISLHIWYITTSFLSQFIQGFIYTLLGKLVLTNLKNKVML